MRNYATEPLAVVTASMRVDTDAWKILGFDKSMLAGGFALRCDATLLEAPGQLRIGWTSPAFWASQRIHGVVLNKECLLPFVTFVITSGKWSMTRLLATTRQEDAILQSLGVDYFSASDYPY